MSDTPQDAVGWEIVDDSIIVLDLKRAPANALGPPIVEGIGAALDAAAQAGGIKVAVVTSALPGIFAAGADIKHMGAISDGAAFTAYGDALRAALDRLAGTDVITIAAIEGLALGGGLELALACHLRVAGAQARLGLPEVKLGLIPGAGGTQRLPRLVGRGAALDIMLTARQVPAAEAKTMGLVDRLVDEGAARDAALEIARVLCAMSLPALRAVVRCVDTAFDTILDEGFRIEIAEEQELFETGEAAEGLAAFLAKRAPNFA